MNAGLAEPRADRLVNHALKSAAMNRELRNIVAGIEPARLAPNLLAETIGIEQLVRPDRHGVQALSRPSSANSLMAWGGC